MPKKTKLRMILKIVNRWKVFYARRNEIAPARTVANKLSIAHCQLSLWSCRESNPGPNKKQRCFLHAYSVFDCREKHGDRHPNSSLSPKISPSHRRIATASPVFFATALPKRNQTVQSSDVSFQHLVPELSKVY